MVLMGHGTLGEIGLFEGGRGSSETKGVGPSQPVVIRA